MLRWIGGGLALIVLIGGGVVGQRLYRLGTFRSIEPHFAGTCRQIGGVRGAEDLTIHPRSGIVYVSAYDRRAASRGEPVAGGIFAYDPAAPDAGLRNLTPEADDGFRPHGISLWVGPDGATSLLVINHPAPGPGRPAHSVEIFDVEGDRLIPRATLTDPARLVMPNDLVAVGPDRFYLTNTHRYPPGRDQTLETYLERPGARVLFYDGSRFREALTGRVFPNGINVSADGRSLYLAESTPQRLSVFDRDPATEKLELRREIHLGTGPDNVELDDQGRVWIGAHPKMLSLLAHASDPTQLAPSQVIRVSPDSGAIDEIYLDSGEEIAGASVGAFRDGHLLIGQIFDEGILDCTL